MIFHVEYLLLLSLWVVWAPFSAAIAGETKRSRFTWFLAGLVMGPLSLVYVLAGGWEANEREEDFERVVRAYDNEPEPDHRYTKDHKEEYNQVLSDLQQDKVENAKALDTALLTLASGFLAFSLSFIKDVVPLERIRCPWLLYVSWGLFLAVIASHMRGYLVALRNIGVLRNAAHKYYRLGKISAQRESAVLIAKLSRLNALSLHLFFAGAVSAVVFVVINIESERAMAEKKLHKDALERIVNIPLRDDRLQKSINPNPMPEVIPTWDTVSSDQKKPQTPQNTTPESKPKEVDSKKP